LFYYLSVIHKCHIIADLLFTINDDNDTLRILIYWFKIPKSDFIRLNLFYKKPNMTFYGQCKTML